VSERAGVGESTAAPHGLDLSRELAAEEIRRVHSQHWSGVLAFEQGQIGKRLYFVAGDLAFAGSSLEEDRLGAHLYRAGKITEAQFRAAMRASEGTGRHIGGALRRAGVLTAGELLEAVSGHFERIVLSVLRWTSGTLRREPLVGPLPAGDPMGLDPRPLLLVGTRQFPAAARLEAALGPGERRLRRVQPQPFDVESLVPTPSERAVLALCRQGCPVGRLLGLQHPREEVVRAVYGLLASGLVEDDPASGPA
jgi:hypothetical protein